MTQNFKIRKMQVDDLHAVNDVQCLGFDKSFWEPVETFQKILNVYPSGSCVAEVGGKIVAYAILQPADENRDDFDTGFWDIRGDEECLYLHDMCLVPAARGQGIAQALFTYLEEHGKESRFKKLIGISVQKTEAFWEKMGFTMERDCRYLDQPATFMSKPL